MLGCFGADHCRAAHGRVEPSHARLLRRRSLPCCARPGRAEPCSAASAPIVAVLRTASRAWLGSTGWSTGRSLTSVCSPFVEQGPMVRRRPSDLGRTARWSRAMLGCFGADHCRAARGQPSMARLYRVVHRQIPDQRVLTVCRTGADGEAWDARPWSHGRVEPSMLGCVGADHCRAAHGQPSMARLYRGVHRQFLDQRVLTVCRAESDGEALDARPRSHGQVEPSHARLLRRRSLPCRPRPAEHGSALPDGQKKRQAMPGVFRQLTDQRSACARGSINPAGGPRRRALLPARRGSCRCTSG